MQNTHIPPRRCARCTTALIDVVGFFNRPQNDAILLREAGVSLDRALFPLLVLIQRRGPLGVGELADRVGRDYTTVSRQVAKLENLGLVARRAGQDRPPRDRGDRHRKRPSHVRNAGRGARAAGSEGARELERGRLGGTGAVAAPVCRQFDARARKTVSRQPPRRQGRLRGDCVEKLCSGGDREILICYRASNAYKANANSSS